MVTDVGNLFGTVAQILVSGARFNLELQLLQHSDIINVLFQGNVFYV